MFYELFDFIKMELSDSFLSSRESSPLTILLTLFMLYLGFHLWKIWRLNKFLLLKDPIKYTHTFINFHAQRWFNNRSDLSPNSLYLNEKYLRVVKLAHRAGDSKAVVDRATKKPVEDVLDALKTLNEANLDEIKSFVEYNLHEPGYEIDRAHFLDWESRPKFLDNLQNKDLIDFCLSLNRIWLDLYKKFNKSKLLPGCVSSHLDMKHPFVVPGGRFIEIYYWDTYWTIEGLLVCGMFTTARQMLENFIEFINLYGFIPNGSRIYYLNRSQPPYFCQMVEKYYDYCMHSSEISTEAKLECERFVLEIALPKMIQEHNFWMKRRVVEFDGFKFNVYRANTTDPRPESYFEDIETAKMYNNLKDRAQLFQDIASAAESGYDFCSRWFNDSMNLNTISTTKIIPVDLNSIIYRNEVIIAKLCFKKGDYSNGDLYKNYAKRRRIAINKFLWSKEDLCWSDYNLIKKELNKNFYVTDLSPLWMGILPPDEVTVSQIICKHGKFFRSFDGGVPVSSINNNQQWDFPNVWAPNQYVLVHGLLRHNQDELALSVARCFFKSVHSGWTKTGCIYEKYSAVCSGERGGGGEYEVQSGFGWTNGVVLSFIRTFKDQLIEN